MRVLFIGGNGNISWSCTCAALTKGHEVYVLNRGLSGSARRALPAGVQELRGDMSDPASVLQALGELRFDAVADFICYTPEQAARNVELFQGRTRQYLFISTASAYQKPLASVPITESTPLANPWWEYSRKKIACEELLLNAWRKQGFPVTIVRPSHTYDTIIPAAMGSSGWTHAQRLLDGRPVVLHGDGTSLWTLTHAEDFARALVGLLGNSGALGHAFHITGDEWLSWRSITTIVADALGAPAPRFVCVPSAAIAARRPELGAGLLGDKAWCALFDNSKIKTFVPGWRATIPFHEGVRRSIAFFRADPARQKVDRELDAFYDGLCAEFGALNGGI